MEDSKIVALYWARSEDAIVQTQRKYHRYCFTIANNILPIREDAEESVNDTYLAAWNAMPPNRPRILSTFLGKLTRRISIDRWRMLTADKRGGGSVPLALDELSQCIPGGADPAKEAEAKELAVAVGRFLDSLPADHRRIFLMRYFELATIQDISAKTGLRSGTVKSLLHRMRNKLRLQLQKEGY